MKRWILPGGALLIVAAIAWPFLFGGGTVDVKGVSFAVEHRVQEDGPASRRSPTMMRPALGKGQAILCSWDRDRFLYFWSTGSKATFDVAFLDAAGKVLQVGRMRPHRGQDFLDDEGIASTVPARRALFLPEGAADDTRLAAGDSVKLSADLLDAKTESMTEIKVAGNALRVEISETLVQRGRGLMHRPKLSPDEGMLFLYRKATTGLSYYMRHTLTSLDIAYFDGKGKLVNVRSTQRADKPATEGHLIHAKADGAAQYVLEVPIGWFRERGLVDDTGKPAKEVILELPESLRQRVPKAEEAR